MTSLTVSSSPSQASSQARPTQSPSSSTLRKLARLFTDDIHFVSSRQFDAGPDQDLRPAFPAPPPLDEFFEGRLLAAKEEAAAFWQMNFHKAQAAKLRDQQRAAFDVELCSHRRNEWPPPEDFGVLIAVAEEIQAHLAHSRAYRNGLVRVFMRLTVSIARQFVNDQYPFDDLLSEASLTLLQAIENFNADYGFRFSTYATRAIRRNLYRYIMKQRKLRQQETAADQLDATPDYRASEKVRMATSTTAASALQGILGQLRERDEYIVRRRFGLYRDLPPCTLQSVADELGVTRERVRQIEGRALRKLRVLAEEEKLEELLL